MKSWFREFESRSGQVIFFGNFSVSYINRHIRIYLSSFSFNFIIGKLDKYDSVVSLTLVKTIFRTTSEQLCNLTTTAQIPYSWGSKYLHSLNRGVLHGL